MIGKLPESEARYHRMPDYAVLNPGSKLRGNAAVLHVMIERDGKPDVFIGSCATDPGVHTPSEEVIEEARRRGCDPYMEDNGRSIYFADFNGNQGEDPLDVVEQLDQAGVALVKLPDEPGSRYYRWYLLA